MLCATLFLLAVNAMNGCVYRKIGYLSFKSWSFGSASLKAFLLSLVIYRVMQWSMTEGLVSEWSV